MSAGQGELQPNIRRTALVPIKGLTQAKSRLAAALTAETRAALSLAMLADVLAAVQASGLFDQTWVLTGDEAVAVRAAQLGATVWWESQPNGLNAALAAAIAQALAHRPDEILILPGDVPLVQAADLQAVAGTGAGQDRVVIAPSQDGGTSALLLRPPTAIAPCFGRRSAQKHAAAAQQAGVALHWCQRPRLARDIDQDADLLYLASHGPETQAWQVLAGGQRRHAGGG